MTLAATTLVYTGCSYASCKRKASSIYASIAKNDIYIYIYIIHLVSTHSTRETYQVCSPDVMCVWFQCGGRNVFGPDEMCGGHNILW